MRNPTPEEWSRLDAFLGPTQVDEAAALGEVFDRLTLLADLAPPLTMQLRACALAVAVVARRLEARGVAEELTQL